VLDEVENGDTKATHGTLLSGATRRFFAIQLGFWGPAAYETVGRPRWGGLWAER
jgi:hypothetical protein